MMLLLALLLFSCAAFSLVSVDASLRVIYAESANPNSQKAGYGSLSAATGEVLPISSFPPVGGVLTNEIGRSKSSQFEFVSINISTVQNYLYTVDEKTGSVGDRVTLPGLLPTIEGDIRTGKTYGTLLLGATFHFVEQNAHSKEFESVFVIGDKLEQSPGFSSFCPVAKWYFAMFQAREGTRLYSIDVVNKSVVWSPVVYGAAQSSSIEWDYSTMKMYMISKSGYDESTLYRVCLVSFSHS
jgi:hypothetical protein